VGKAAGAAAAEREPDGGALRRPARGVRGRRRAAVAILSATLSLEYQRCLSVRCDDPATAAAKQGGGPVMVKIVAEPG